MKYIIISIQDLKSCYLGLTLERTVDTAKRSFMSIVKTPGNQVSDSPNDYRLWCLGSFDPETGEIMVYDKPYLICDGSEVQK